MKYNIPARTLRDWMKRLNIKSVFTHNHSSSSSSTSSPSTNSNKTSESSAGNSKSLPKTNITVTSVDTSSATIAIKDINKLKAGNTNANAASLQLVTKQVNQTSEDDDESNVVIKTENVADENEGNAKMKQVIICRHILIE